MTRPVLPVVHLNGTSREALIAMRLRAGSAVAKALDAMAEEMAPNGRDYYPAPGRLAAAEAQHRRRVAVLKDLLAEIQAEAEILADGTEAEA